MADAFRGLTIRLGADARPLNSALSSIRSSASQAQKQLNAMEKALKFDGTNMAAMNARLDLTGDKAELAARSVRRIKTAMSQAVAETKAFDLKKVASQTTDVYAATNKLLSEYRHVDTELAHIYEGAAKIKAAQDGIKFEDALKHVQKLSREFNESAASARELTRLVQLAGMTKSTGLAQMFGLGGTNNIAAGAQLAKHTLVELRNEHVRLQQSIEGMHRVEGYRAMQTQLIAWESELKQAVAETTRFKSELFALGKGGSLIDVANRLKMVDESLGRASASARNMKGAVAAMPKSSEAIRASLHASAAEFSLIAGKADALRAKLKSIEETPGFDRVAAQSRDVYTAFNKASEGANKMRFNLENAKQDLSELINRAKELGRNKPTGFAEKIKEMRSDIQAAREEVRRYETAVQRADTVLASATLSKEWRETYEAELMATAQAERYFSQASRIGQVTGTLRTMGYGLYSTLTPAILMAGRYAVQAANDVDSAYRDMRKTVNGTEEQFEHLRSAALEFSRTHVTSADAILEIEAIGGQLSIASENLETFSRVVSSLDIATNLDTETISQNLGQLSNIMRDMNQDLDSGPGSLEAFSDSLVRLGNNSAAQEDKIMNVMMRIASMGTISGMATPDLLALATATAATGQGAEAAGTALSRTFSQIESAVGKGGDKLEKFAEVAGMSAGEFADAWGNRPMEAFTAFINGLKRVDEEGGSVANTLSELGINSVRQRQTLMGLTTTTDVLTEALIMSNDAWNGIGDTWGAAGDAAREAQRKSEGFSGQLQILKNAAQGLGVELLDGAVPALKGITGAVQAASAALAAMPDWGKSMAVKAAAALALAGPLLVSIGAIANGVNQLGEAWSAVKSGLTARSLAKGEIAQVNAALSKCEMQIRGVTAAQERQVAMTGTENALLAKHKAALEEDRAALMRQKQAYETAAAGAAKFKSALKAAAAVTGFMVALEVIGMIASAIGEAVEKAREYEQATKGLEDSSRKFADSLREVESGADSQADSMKSALDGVTDYSSAVEDAIKGNIELSEAFDSNFKTAQSTSALVESYATKIMELADGSELSAEKQSLLNRYVEAFNQLTGSSIQVIDARNGALNVGNDAIEKYVELSRKQAYADASKKNAEAATQRVAETQATYNALLEEEKKITEEMHSKKFVSSSWADQFEMSKYKNRLGEVRNELNKLKPTLESAQKSADEMWDLYEGQIKGATDATAKMGAAAKEAGSGVEALNFDVEEADEELEELADSLESLSEQFPQFASMFANSGLDVQQFSDMLGEMGLTMEDVAKGMEDMAKKVSDGFNEIQVDAEMSLQKYMETLQHNKEVTAAWGDNLKALYEKSSDETYQAWVRSIAEMGPEYAQLVADMVNLSAEELEGDARSWQEAYELGAGKYLDSIGWTSSEVQTKVEQMVNGTQDKLNRLKNIGIEIHVDDGTIRTTEEKLTHLDRKRLADKGFAVSDNGTIYDMTEKIGEFRVVEIEDKIFFVDDAGTIYDETGKVSDLSNLVSSIPRNVRTVFSADTSAFEGAISRIRNQIWLAQVSAGNIKVGGHASGGIIPAHASGGAFNRIIRALPRNASGGINGIVTRPTLTNIGWVGEAGAEALLHMRNAGGAVVPLTNRRYVRPFARAVASEMGGGSTVNNYNITLDYDAGDDAATMARDLGRIMRASARMGG